MCLHTAWRLCPPSNPSRAPTPTTHALAALHPPQMVEVFMPQYLPMLVAPVPWLRNNLGGHLTLRNNGACRLLPGCGCGAP